MAATRTVVVVAAGSSPLFRPDTPLAATAKLRLKTKYSVSATTRRRSVVVVSTEQEQRLPTSVLSKNGKYEKEEETVTILNPNDDSKPAEVERLSLKDYFERSKDLIRSDGGPPRWFSPLECASRSHNSPLFLFLPGIDGVGLGLITHFQRLGEIFDIWCLHIPVMDRTPFPDLVKLVERTVQSEYYHSPKRPIYLVGESLGGCLALAVAALNPDIDLILILANPATCVSKSQLQLLIPVLSIMPEQLHLSLPYILSLITGDPLRTARTAVQKGLSSQHTVGELSEGVMALSSYLSVLADILPRETLLWKLQMVKSASAFANSRLHAIKAQTLILCSGMDQLLPSLKEGERLHQALPNCQIRKFNDSGHFLLLEDGVDLVTIIKGTSFYRRARYLDYVSDYFPPSPSEFEQIHNSHRWLEVASSPVMFSTLENGTIVRGLAGIPSEGPVLFVGYHMLLGWELVPLVTRFWAERNIVVRGIAHPMMFMKLRQGNLPDVSNFDSYRVMGAVPVSAANFYRLLSSKSHVLLYPGGMREALHRKGEEYKLFWPEQSEFVRMAARFGAKIIPFGVVGEDDVGQVVFDYDDLMKIPFFKTGIQELTNEATKLRSDSGGEVANQDVHLPIVLPKLPGRFYFRFGKPIETQGRKQELRSREKAHELYLEVKSEVENCIVYLKERRENDPYRHIFPRLIYQATHGFDSEVPTFEL